MAETFETFLDLWLNRLEGHLQNLLHAIEFKENEQRCNDLIHKTISLYGEYFTAKERIARENVFLVVSPTWFSSFERAHLWIGGFRPGLAFRLIQSNVKDLTGDQTESINRLMEEIKTEEKQVCQEFSRVQNWMVSSPIIEMARHVGMLRNGEVNKMDSAFDEMKMRMEGVVECADFLRKKAAGVLVMEILKPQQAVVFLAAAASLQLTLRSWGMHRNVHNY